MMNKYILLCYNSRMRKKHTHQKCGAGTGRKMPVHYVVNEYDPNEIYTDTYGMVQPKIRELK